MRRDQELTLADAIEIVVRRLYDAGLTKEQIDEGVERQRIRNNPTEPHGTDLMWLSEMQTLLRLK